MSTPVCALCEIRFLLLTHSFKSEMSEWSLEPIATLSVSGSSFSSQKGIHCHWKAAWLSSRRLWIPTSSIWLVENRCELIVTAARPYLPALSAPAIRWDGLASQTKSREEWESAGSSSSPSPQNTHTHLHVSVKAFFGTNPRHKSSKLPSKSNRSLGGKLLSAKRVTHSSRGGLFSLLWMEPESNKQLVLGCGTKLLAKRFQRN